MTQVVNQAHHKEQQPAAEQAEQTWFESNKRNDRHDGASEDGDAAEHRRGLLMPAILPRKGHDAVAASPVGNKRRQDDGDAERETKAACEQDLVYRWQERH